MALPIGLAPGDGRRVWMFGDTLTMKATASETDGRMSAVELHAEPGGGQPPHSHSGSDEAVYVLEGEFEVTAGADVARLGAGGFAYFPRGLRHGLACVGESAGRLLIVAAL